ncbi:GntR family transcriptional regulator [Marinimicrobium sp. ABcell2]|uniref:GntR family transcriptional regulator n=1 Tax=Marinimicrobium sp. ABcell2 TaxID=3069751 RepID=UPI0027B2CBEE|nr:GntR family transcriptional regulator [Marinimicrobium sp. ABcell2]MDQ2076828.1 GntR family transcriptional regulator [Marinimicrobium sp. ABcell2]
MQEPWRDDEPIYRQLRQRILALILKGALKEGEAIPSVRQVAADYQINHLTVAKAYQELVELELVEKRRGLGMFVLPGARDKVAATERDKLLKDDLPRLLERARQLGISEAELNAQIKVMLKETP